MTRNSSTDSDWKMTPISSATSVLEVAAGTAYANLNTSLAYGFFHDGATLYWTQLGSDGVTWSTPTSVPSFQICTHIGAGCQSIG